MSTVILSKSIYSNSALDSSGILYTLDLARYDTASIQLNYTNNTPAAETFTHSDVTVAASTITLTGTSFITGLKVALTGTNLPTGLSATNYYVILIDANTIQLATSAANAFAGVFVTITGAGTSTDATLTAAVLHQVIALYESNDATNLTAISGKTVTITDTGTTIWDIASPAYRYLTIQAVYTGGELTLDILACLRDNSVWSN